MTLIVNALAASGFSLFGANEQEGVLMRDALSVLTATVTLTDHGFRLPLPGGVLLFRSSLLPSVPRLELRSRATVSALPALAFCVRT